MDQLRDVSLTTGRRRVPAGTGMAPSVAMTEGATTPTKLCLLARATVAVSKCPVGSTPLGNAT